MSASSFQSRTSAPPRSTAPASASQNRAMRFTSVVLPDPDGPTMAQVVPAGMDRLTSSTTVRTPFPSPYEKLTPSRTIPASAARSTSPRSSMSGVESTSSTRSMDASTIGSMNASEPDCSIWL